MATAVLSDWRTIENEREKYAAYLCSREWSVLKEAVHKRSGGICERCRLMQGDAVHHLTYKRKYREKLGDLQHTCTLCHEFTHGKSDLDPVDNLMVELICEADEIGIRPTPVEFVYGDLALANDRIVEAINLIDSILDFEHKRDGDHDSLVKSVYAIECGILGFASMHECQREKIKTRYTIDQYKMVCNAIGCECELREDERRPRSAIDFRASRS